MGWYLEKVPSGEKIPLNTGITSIGRMTSSTLQLLSVYCSRNHCNIEVDAAGKVKLVDFSSNGTYVNEQCYGNMDVLIKEGDRIGIGCWAQDEGNPENMPIYVLRRDKPSDVIEISDEEDEGIDLCKYSIDNSREDVKIDKKEQIVQPQFLPATIVVNDTASTSRDMKSAVSIDNPNLKENTSPPSLLPYNSTSSGLPSVTVDPLLVQRQPLSFLPSVSDTFISCNEAASSTSGNQLSFLPSSSTASIISFLPSVDQKSSTLVASPEEELETNRPPHSPQFLKPTSLGHSESKSTAMPNTSIAVQSTRNSPSPVEMDVDIPLSQSILLDIKQEAADLECEESFDLKLDDDEHYLAERVDSIHIDDVENERKESANRNLIASPQSSPIFVIDDDDDDEDIDGVASAWFEKLSQTYTPKKPKVQLHNLRSNDSDHVKVEGGETSKHNLDLNLKLAEEEKEKVTDDRSKRGRTTRRESRHSEKSDYSSKDKDNEERIKKLKDDGTKEIPEPVIHLTRLKINQDEHDNSRIDAKEESKRVEKRKLDQVDSVPSTSRKADEINLIHLEPKRRRPVVIDAPALPTGRGRKRAHAAIPSTTIRQETERKLAALRHNDRLINQEKCMKDKWRQKPSLERIEQKRRRESIKEERKVKLKELADQNASKRKSEIDEQKVVKKPKIKVTEKNRSTLLAEGFEGDNKATTRSMNRRRSSTIDNYDRHDDERSSKSDKEEPSTSKENKTKAVNSRRISTFDIFDKKYCRNSTTKSKENVFVEKSIDIRETENQSNKLKKRRATGDLKSILKAHNQNSQKKSQKSVKFKEKPEIRYFESEVSDKTSRKVDCKEPQDSEIFEKMHLLKFRKVIPWVDHSETLLSEILGWNPSWLETRQPEVNGSNHALMPMMQQYESFDAFSRIVLPLYKIELWHSIAEEYMQRSKMEFHMFRLQQFSIEKRTKSQRFVCQCEVNLKSIKERNDFIVHQLCLVKFNAKGKSIKMFGFITFAKTITLNATQEVLNITIELRASQSYRPTIETAVNIAIKPITNIRVDIGVYNAVNYLQYSPLRKCILNPFELTKNNVAPSKPYGYVGYNELNGNQLSILLNAYQKCIDSETSNNIQLIEGPPGTGKSRIITNLALQILYGSENLRMGKKKRILICAQSNAAIDIVALKLLEIRGKMDKNRFNLVRFGVHERMHIGIRGVSTQVLVANSMRDAKTEANRRFLKNERQLIERQIETLSASAGPDNVLRDELQKKKDRLALLNRMLSDTVPTTGFESHYPKFLCGANIVCTTLSSCIKMLNYVKNFDVCIIDEATQCSEPYTLIPLQFGISSLILVGDTQQLPATVLSGISEEHGFGTSLFTRVQKCLEGVKNNAIQMLKTQYRMHPEICQWPNSFFYKNLLINDESTHPTKTLIKPYVVLNLEYSQSSEEERGKLWNSSEAKFVVDLITKLDKIMSTKYFSYGVITPYTQQRDYLQRKINERGIKCVLVNTIDSYQGKEKDVIIFSCVRTRGVGFLGNCQRLNVALTRAKKCLLICGNFNSLMREPVWKSLLENAKRRGIFHNIKNSDADNFDAKVMCHIQNNVI